MDCEGRRDRRLVYDPLSGIVLSRGMVEFLARFERSLNNEEGIRGMLSDITFRDHHGILSEAKTPQVAVYLLSSLSTVTAIGHDDQSIQIAIRSHISTGGRTK